MDLWILNANFERLGIVDTASSIIWANRYRQCGDFEIYAPASMEMIQLLKLDNCVVRPDDDMVGIIEKMEIGTDEENGDYIIASGRSACSILDRRIVLDQVVYSDTVENIMRALINDNFTTGQRAVPQLTMAAAHGYTTRAKVQYTGDVVLEAIEKLCAAHNYGFKMSLEDGKLVLDFYQGADRSTGQSENPRVIFSEKYDNLVATTYTVDKTGYKTFAHVKGEGEGSDRKHSHVQQGDYSGLRRREMYVDARDVSSNEGEITEADYTILLEQRARESLNEAVIVQSVEGTIEPLQMYAYKKDYFLGDTVTVINKFGLQVDSQVLEIVETWDENGYICTPTFG